MRSGITAMGAVETAMLNVACAQVAKSLGLPTHGYLIGSDAKRIDAQAGLESGIAALMGALGGINMISGAGMLDSLACHSAEKLVIDAESIAMAQRVVQGIEPRTESLALEMFAKVGEAGDFLKLPETRKLFRSEQYLPSKVIDRGTLNSWEHDGKKDAFARARERVQELLSSYKHPELTASIAQDLRMIVEQQAKKAGMDHLPGI
jgi:trimethylamine--corrinoid protein Co-methyltransferase